MWLSQVELLSPKQTLVSRKQAKRDPGARPRLDLTQSAEPVRGDSDARARGSTQRKQHLDEDPPRARSPRVTEVSSSASRSLGRLCAFNTLTAFPLIFSTTLFAHCCGCVCCVLSAELESEKWFAARLKGSI